MSQEENSSKGEEMSGPEPFHRAEYFLVGGSLGLGALFLAGIYFLLG